MLFVSLHLHRLHKISKIRNILSESDAEELVKEHGMKTESFRNLINWHLINNKTQKTCLSKMLFYS